MNVLVLCDDFWHPARTPRSGLEPLSARGFHFDFIENAHDWSAERMANYPVVLLTKSNNVSAGDRTPWMTGSVEQAFLSYVKGGNGLLAVHSGTAEYASTTVLRALLGGVFAHHPDQCPVTLESLEDGAISGAAPAFSVFDEPYAMDMAENGADVFLHAVSEYGTQPGGWTRREGLGRVCVITPGHNLATWLHPAFQALLTDALLWCGRRETR